MKKLFKYLTVLILLTFVLTISAFAGKYVKIDSSSEIYADYIAASKTAYKVLTTRYTNGTTYVVLETLDGKKQITERQKDISGVYKSNIILCAEIDGVIYYDKVKCSRDYATSLNSSGGTVRFYGLGQVKYRNVSIDGILDNELDESVVGEDRERDYWVYNGELVYMLPHISVPIYRFAVLRYVEKINTSYFASVYINGSIESFPLDQTNAARINGVEYTAKQMYDLFCATTDDNGNKEYNYTVIADYESTSAGYSLVISENFNKNVYTLIPSGKKIIYDANTGFFSIDGINKIIADKSTRIHYKYDKPASNDGFMSLGTYMYDDMPQTNTDIITCGDTYLYYDEYVGKNVLLTTIITDEIEGATDDDGNTVPSKTPEYVSDGTAIVYAYSSSSTVSSSGKLYNRYSFMDLSTLTNSSAVTDKRREYHASLNSGAEEGYFYGWNQSELKYDKITANRVKSLDFINLGVGVEVLNNGTKILFIANVNGEEETFLMSSKTVIWGLSSKTNNKTYKKLTLTQLENMLSLVSNYNKANRTSIEMNVLMLSTEDASEISYLVVELFEQSNGSLISVNDTIFRNLGIAPDTSDSTLPFITLDKTECYNGDTVKANWNAVTDAYNYTVEVKDNAGKAVYTSAVLSSNTFTHSFSLGEGEYTVTVMANCGTKRYSNKVELTVKRKYYTITYDANGGINAPSAQTKTNGTSIYLTGSVPVNEGKIFVGWGLSPISVGAAYKSNDVYSQNSDITLYAVWAKEPSFLGASLILDGNIGIRAYFDIDSNLVSDCRVSYKQSNSSNDSWGQRSLSYDAKKEAYYVTFDIYAKDADTATISCSLTYGNYNLSAGIMRVTEYIASVRALAKEDAECAKALDLVNALDTYIQCVNAYFKGNPMPVVIADVKAVNSPSKIGSANGITHYATSLILTDDVYINHYFSVETTSHTFISGGKSITSRNLGSGIMEASINSIPIQNLDEIYTVTVDGTLNINFSVLNYLEAVSDDPRIGELAKALYNYWYETEQYLK